MISEKGLILENERWGGGNQDWQYARQLDKEVNPASKWLGDRDSNPDRQSQSLLSCH